jgi:2-oxoglutarate ferredoxin oxidoreductase subunit delta
MRKPDYIPQILFRILDEPMTYWRKPLDIDKIEIPQGDVKIIVDRCKGCGFCVEYCPKGVLEMSDEFNIKCYHHPKVVKFGECVNCGLCEMICPEFAIFSVEATGTAAVQDAKERARREAEEKESSK